MGIALYTEDQVHRRTYAGTEMGERFVRVLAVLPDGLLAGVHPHGDIMINTVQLNRLVVELRALAESGSAVSGDARAVAELAEGVVRNRGYLWLSGD